MASTFQNTKTRSVTKSCKVSSAFGLMFAAALLLSFGAFAQTNVDDVKIDTIVPPGGIKLHGLFSADVLPLPPGSWKVLSRTDTVRDLRVINVNYVQLTLQTTDEESNIPFMTINVNADTANINYGSSKCIALSAKNSIANDFGSTNSQLVNRCGKVLQIPSFAKSFVPNMAKQPIDVAGDLYQLMLDRLDAFSSSHGEATVVMLNANKLRGRNASYQFILKTTDGKDFAPGLQKYEAVKDWVKATGDAVGEFLDGKSVELPGFKEL